MGGGGKGGGSSSTTQTSKFEPWAPAGEIITGEILPAARDIYNNFPQSFVSPWRQQAIGELQGVATNPAVMQGEQGALGLANQLISGQLAPTNIRSAQTGTADFVGDRASGQMQQQIDVGHYQNPFINATMQRSAQSNPYTGGIAAQAGQQNPFAAMSAGVGGMANPYVNQIAQQGGAANPFVQGISQAGAGPNAAGQAAMGELNPNAGSLQYLQDIAQGNQIQNPFTQQVWGGIQDDIAQQVESRFQRAGRSFSPAAAGTMAEQLGRAGNQFFQPLVEQERARQANAAAQLPAGMQQAIGTAGQISAGDRNRMLAGQTQAGALSEQGFGRGLQALGAAGGLQEQGLGRYLQGVGQAGGLAGQDLGRSLQAMTSAAGAESADLNRLLQGAQSAGGLQERAAERALQGVQGGQEQFAELMKQRMAGLGLGAQTQFGEAQQMLGGLQALSAATGLPAQRIAAMEDVAGSQESIENLLREQGAGMPALDYYASQVFPAAGIGGTSMQIGNQQSPYHSNLGGRLMGGAMSGYGLGSSIGAIGGPMGALGGALLGGLLK